MSEAKYGTVKTIMRQALWPEIYRLKNTSRKTLWIEFCHGTGWEKGV